ncbi:Oxygen-independent coproporphyrinogen-III oxidase-like protein [Crateriforma conspicua]|uniref:Heme chaperone HemW n=2 Tax=Crateriforma conspicua TaxID=2527996 RepID=A0A5C5Y0J9_9PLAN|nr:Oxygen-independent coproporphyrinogen-III oxidase-like protein [Crateriforma conspicua]TWT69266.1 Oxygen-independent coproporphyrinogen-III oxidase-like protein [Crateriforma conspicua]
MAADWPDRTAAPRAAYIHVPFCRHRCGYCNFSVVAGRDDLIDRFLTAIDHEMQTWDQPTLNTLFVGGGTPTHLNASQLDRFCQSIRRHVRLADDAEISFEANPEDIDTTKVRQLSDHGVNRISLGVQSFDADKIQRLERGHTAAEAIAAIETAATVIGNVSVDLIFAAPGESVATWQRDLDQALKLPIRHLSAYALTIEKGTQFFARHRKGELRPAGEDDEWQMYQDLRDATAAAGMPQYEVSNFAPPANRCRHNIAYWQGQAWLAAGPGAAAFLNGRRTVNHRSTTTYLKRIESGHSPVAESEPLDADQYARELMAFGVRMIDGVDLTSVARRSGLDLNEKFGDTLRRLIDDALIQRDGDRVRLTPRGLLFADTVASAFL